MKKTVNIKYREGNFVPEVNNECSRKTDIKRTIILLSMVLIIVTLAVYWQVGTHDFITYDDDIYVTNNSHVTTGLSSTNIIWAFTSVGVRTANWHPITWLSHMADVQLFGMDPRWHHLNNVFIHTISAVLLFLLFFRLTSALWQSAFVAALFALHPLHVESVAWVAERKDVLSAFFGFLTLLLYAEYVNKQKIKLYLLTLFAFMLGLMSKPMLVTLPVAMLLLDYWPLNRFQNEVQTKGLSQPWGRAIELLREKVPFFVCSLLSGAMTIYAQNKGTAVNSLDESSLMLRIENALIAYVKYIEKTLWPHDLAVLYPTSFTIPLWQVIGALLLLFFVSAAVIWLRRRYPYLMVGWFWFIVTLVPVIGLIKVGAYSIADRYTYIPGIGLFIIAAWGVTNLVINLPYHRYVLALLAGVVIIASAVLSWQQLGYWQDSISLYQHTLQSTTDNCIINNNLGNAFVQKGDLDSGIKEYEKALAIFPKYVLARINLGRALVKKGDLDAAIGEYQMALTINPNDFLAHVNLGDALDQKGEMDGAIQEYQKAYQINPNFVSLNVKLGIALGRKRTAK